MKTTGHLADELGHEDVVFAALAQKAGNVGKADMPDHGIGRGPALIKKARVKQGWVIVPSGV